MSRLSTLESLHQARPAILPSLLLCDFGHLEQEVRRLEEAGVRALHLDVMDGVFVPNFTYGMTIVAALRKLTKLPLDVHLMMVEPQKYVKSFVEAGADLLTIHVEAVSDPRSVLQLIHSQNVAAGLALNPETPLAAVQPALDLCDLVLVMSVNAGFGGQAFNEVALDKLKTLRSQLPSEILLEVDGGVNAQTIHRASEAGAELFVVGSALFGNPDYSAAVKQLTDLAAK